MNFIKSIIKGVVVTIAVFITIAVLIALALPSDEEMQQGMNDIHNQVALDAERQYASVAEHGSAIDRCVRAGLVAEGYLQAHDDASYKTWKAVERKDCAAAGIVK